MRQARHRIRLGRGTRYTRNPEDVVRLGRKDVIRPSTSKPPRRQRQSVQTGLAATSAVLLHPLVPDVDPTSIKVSVVFGTYNRRGLLIRCIESIRVACKEIPFEIVVCDGGSTDGSAQWLEQQDDVILVRGDLSGAVNAFNAAARRATGEFVVTLNDDAELKPPAIHRALDHFRNPQVGQVAMSFFEGGRWKIEEVFKLPYANFAVTRRSIVEAVTKISGGLWATCYKTYGGDTELSCWVYRLGYKVVVAQDAQVVHHEHQDRLRSQNVNTDHQRRQFWQRWNTDALTFRGPLPGISAPEVDRLKAIEAGEMPQDRWLRISALDPVRGEPSPQAAPKRERVLHWQLLAGDDPQNSMVGALRGLGSAGHKVVPWPQVPASDRGRVFVEAMRAVRPTIAFLQCQEPVAIPLDALQEARSDPGRDPSLVICVWSGDIGPGKGPWAASGDEWQYRIANLVDLMLFTGTGQVQIHRSRGMTNAAYLQIGYDINRYYPGPDEGYGSRHKIVFIGRDYGLPFHSVPTNEVQLRREAVAALASIPGFSAYGPGFGPQLAQENSGGVYRGSAMALSISLCSSLGRYSSDRLMRSMACACPTLVKRFDDMEAMGLVDRETCLVWDHSAELVEKAQWWLRPEHRADLRNLGNAGAKLMRERHTWDARMKELAALVAAVRKQA